MKDIQEQLDNKYEEIKKGIAKFYIIFFVKNDTPYQSCFYYKTKERAKTYAEKQKAKYKKIFDYEIKKVEVK